MIGKDYEKLMKLTYKFEQKELYPSFKIRVYIHGFWSKKKKNRERQTATCQRFSLKPQF
jgi:hypothetical protein